MARNNRRRIDRIVVTADDTTVVGHAGLISFMQWCARRGVFRLAARRLPTPGTTGYPVEDMLKTLWTALLLRGGREVLDVINDLRCNSGLVAMLGMEAMPSSTAVADWLRRLAGVELRHDGGARRRTGWEHGLAQVQNLFYELTAEVLRALRSTLSRTLDFDASVIPERKKYAAWTYEKELGTMGYFGFIDEVCVLAELEPGNHSPNDHIAERTASCVAVCAMAGTPVRKLRSDAAGYAAALLDQCQNPKAPIRFYVRAPHDPAVQATIRAIQGDAWAEQQVRMAHDRHRAAELAETAHAMNNSKHGFRLVVEKRTEEEADTVEDDGLLVRVPRTVTRYWSVATNDHAASCAEVLSFYNQRQGASEQGNDRLKNDVCIGALPCRGEHGFDPNRVFAWLCALLHNLAEWYKHDCLPTDDRPLRLPTIVQRDFALAARVTLHESTISLRLANYARAAAAALQHRIDAIRRKIKRLRIPPVAPAFAPLIFRRI